MVRCLKLDATYCYDNDLLLRKVHWRPFEIRPVKDPSFKLETSNQWFLIDIISASSIWTFF